MRSADRIAGTIRIIGTGGRSDPAGPLQGLRLTSLYSLIALVIGRISDTSATTSALAALSANSVARARALTSLATGRSINRAADGPARMITGESLRAAIAQFAAKSSSLQRTNQVANVADGYLAEASALRSETQTLEVQLANTGAMSDAERDAIQFQIDAANQAADQQLNSATFNGQALFTGQMTLQANGDILDLPELSGAELDTLVDMRGQIGAFQSNSIEPALRSNQVAIRNLSAARSRIVDTDYANTLVDLIRTETVGRGALHALEAMNTSRGLVLDLLS